MRRSAPRVAVLGGAGFVGSAIARVFAAAGWIVEILDCLHPATFADLGRLRGAAGDIRVDTADVRAIGNLSERLAAQDAVVNAIGWTRHSAGEHDPALDLDLNLGVHLAVFRALAGPAPLYVHLGTLHQFGGATGTIFDTSPFRPVDAQSIHKCAAEHHVRLLAERKSIPAVVLRLGNCIGPGQPVGEGDVGLIGGFMRELALGRTIEVFDGRRIRHICYTPDIGRIALQVASREWSGFNAINIPGQPMEIVDLARKLRELTGRGAVALRPMPDEAARREIGRAVFEAGALQELLPGFTPTPMEEAVRAALRDTPALGQPNRTEGRDG